MYDSFLLAIFFIVILYFIRGKNQLLSSSVDSQESLFYSVGSFDSFSLQNSTEEASVRLCGAVLAACPSLRDLKKEEFKQIELYSPSLFMATAKTFGTKCDINACTSIIMASGASFSYRRTLVRTMFQLARMGDGIKDDEWNFILDAAKRLKINTANIDYLVRLYSNYRTGATAENRFFYINNSLPNCMVRLINELVQLNPKGLNKEMVASFFKEHKLETFSLGSLGHIEENLTLRMSVDTIVKGTPKKTQTAFMHLLYKLAATDDGIKYDEWLLLGFLLNEFKLNYTYFYRRYSGLRTEGDNYDTYSYFSSKYYGTNNSNSQSSGSQSQSSGKSSSAGKEDLRLADAFKILGVSSTSTKEEVQGAYHRLALLHHPDLPRNAERRAECVRAMAKINVAYATVSKSFV